MCCLKTGCQDAARVNQQFAIESNLVCFRGKNCGFSVACVLVSFRIALAKLDYNL